MAVNKNIASIDEYAAASAAIEDGYIKGLVTGDFDTIATTFHPEATVYGFFDVALLGGSFKGLKDYVDTYGAAKNMKWRIEILQMTTTMATARIELEDCGCGNNYTDYHHLMKFDGRWKVISKMFHQYDRA